MLPLLSLIISMYVITRYIEIIASTQEHLFVKLLSTIFIFITVICVFDIFASGNSIPAIQ